MLVEICKKNIHFGPKSHHFGPLPRPPGVGEKFGNGSNLSRESSFVAPRQLFVPLCWLSTLLKSKTLKNKHLGQKWCFWPPFDATVTLRGGEKFDNWSNWLREGSFVAQRHSFVLLGWLSTPFRLKTFENKHFGQKWPVLTPFWPLQSPPGLEKTSKNCSKYWKKVSFLTQSSSFVFLGWLSSPCRSKYAKTHILGSKDTILGPRSDPLGWGRNLEIGLAYQEKVVSWLKGSHLCFWVH